ncbi:succinylglutamate desuccinylase [Pseudomonas sp. 3A(2025)]
MLALGKLLDLTLAGREPAEKTQLTVGGVRLRWLDEGALEVRPPQGRDSGLDLLLSAGIHGNETAPIELLDELIRAIARGELKPRARILFLFGNPEAMRRGVRYVEEDVNRLFSGKHEQSSGPEALRACLLERLAASFFSLPERERVHYDLHTALRGSKIEQFALSPWKDGRQPSQFELARLQAAGISAVLLQSKPSTVFSAYTRSQLDAQAFTLELGKSRPFGHNQQVNLSALRERLTQMIEGTEPASEGSLQGLQLFRVAQEVIKYSESFLLHLAEDVENFSVLQKDYVLAQDIGGKRWVIEQKGTRVIFPNPRVASGLRAAILIVPAEDVVLED